MLDSGDSIKYIAFYNDEKVNKNENRVTFLSTNNKVEYICDVLSRLNYKIEIISPCWTKNKKGFYFGKTYELSKHISLKQFATFGSNSNILRKFRTIFSGIQLFLFLIFNVSKNEQIIVYHTPAIIKPISIAKKIKKFKVIAEVEEIYSKVWDEWSRKCSYEKEVKYLKSADKYILVSEQLFNLFEPKRSIVLYGAYSAVNYEKIKKSTNIIDVVYAGTIDSIRMAAENAVLCANYLPDNYRIHILGDGDKVTVSSLLKKINMINIKKGYDCCIYHGVKTGEDLKLLMRSFDIALNSQVVGAYMETAFPSKILFYLSFNLRVISTKIPNIENSIISQYINFAKGDTPEGIAEAIKLINISEVINTSVALKKLDKEFTYRFENLFEIV